ncbi:hypothetical protein MMC13_006118 [Lambiella insularis]|nr:hypothetical protein [Lambiella insularis]
MADSREIIKQTTPSKPNDNILIHGETRPVTAFDDEGDIILSLQSTCLLVASKVLKLASPIFRSLLDGNFSCSIKLCNKAKGLPVVHLEEDNAEALVLLCRLVHFQTPQPLVDDSTEAIKLLKHLANICKEYEGKGAAQYYVSCWMDQNPVLVHRIMVPEFLAMLWITHAFNLQKHFAKASKDLASCLGGNNAEAFEQYDELMSTILAAIRAMRAQLIVVIQITIAETLKDLMFGKAMFATIGEEICQKLGTELCLQEQGVSLSDKLRKRATVDVVRDTGKFDFVHHCEGFSDCPLKIAMKQLKGKVVKAITDEPGLKLSEYK